jgi:hypothetical protein
MSGGFLLAVMPRRWASARRVVVAPITVTTIVFAFCASAGIAIASIDELTFAATEPRTTALACRRTGSMEVCVWPESAGRAAALIGSARGVSERLRAWGLPPIARLSERDSGREWIEIGIGPRFTRPELTQSILAGYIDHIAGCRFTYGRWSEERSAFLELEFGADAADLKYSRLPAVVAEAERRVAAARADPATVRGWFLADRDHARCSP